MDFLLLSRFQFAAATIFHFIFIPLTLGLSLLVAIMETRYVKTGDETYLAMAKFWGKIFLINFALGVVTGLTLEFQFGTNWGAFSVFVGGIFGPILAFETTSSFFLESVFLGVWIFGWKKVSKGFHAACMCWRLPMYFRAWSASAITIAGAALFGLVGLFPRLLPSTIDSAFSLTTSNSASEPLSLKIMFIIVSIFIPLVLIYQGYAYSIFKHPVTADDIESEETY